MKIQLNDILKTLNDFENKITVLSDNGPDIKSVCFFNESIPDFNSDTLYICTDSSIYNPSKVYTKINIIAFKSKNSAEIQILFNTVSKLLYYIQKINSDIATLTKALYSGKGLQHIVDVASELLGNPFFIRD